MNDPKLSDEDGRLAALRRYEILDTAPEEPFRRIVDLVRTVLGVPMAAISLIDGNRQWLKASGGPLEKEIPRDVAFCNETIKHRVPDGDPRRCRRRPLCGQSLVIGMPHIRSYLGVPLTSPDGYNVGTLCAIDSEPRPFDAREAGILKALAEIVVEQLELRQIARQDGLTGALTRRGFFSEVEREVVRASRYDRPSALIMLDVDNFKQINDRHGHPAGDAVLVAIANACMATMRKSDVFGRIGGEEFGLLLPETDAGDAFEAAERIRRAVEGTIVEMPGRDVRATISCGVAPLPSPAQGAAGWFAEAEIALYEAKRFGRNQSVVGKSRREIALAGAPAEPPALRPH